MAQITIDYTRANRIISNLATTAFADQLSIGENNADAQIQRGLILLPFTGLPANATITGVTLQIYNNDNSLATNAATLRAYRVKRAWTAAATWNTYDGSNNWQTAGGLGANDIDATDIGNVAIAAAQAIGYISMTLDVTAVTEMYTGSFTNNGLLVKSTAESDDLHEFSVANPPRWVIDYTVPLVGAFGYAQWL